MKRALRALVIASMALLAVPALLAADAPAEAGNAADAGAVRATLKASALVEGDWVTLGDVVEFAEKDAAAAEAMRRLRLWRAPMPGIERVVTSDDVAKRVRNAGVPEGIVLEGAPDVRIGVKSTTLSGEKLVEFGRKELESRSQVAGVTFSIEDPKAPSPVTIRGTDVTLRAEVSPRKPWGLVPVTVEAWSVGKRQARFIMSFRVRATGPVAQLARGVEPGAVITDDDLVEAERDLSTVPDDAIRSREAIVGLTVARAMQSGSYVRRGSVKQSALVKKGGQVTLVARVGTVEARANAQSRDDGASGDVVTVVNMASRRTIRARVVSQDEVEAVVP